MMTLFAPLQTTLSTVYNQTITYTNFGTSLITNICYIPANFLANYIIDTFGLRIGLLTGSVLTVGGLWMRCLSLHSFTWIFLGQLLGGIGQPFFLCIPAKIANIWFGVHERTTATTVLLTSLNIGVIISSYVPQFFVNIYADNATILNQVQNMMFWFAVIGSFCLVLLVIFMKDRPPTPPSKAAAALKYNFIDSLKTLIKDCNSMTLIASTAFVIGTLNTYFGTLQQIVQPFGIDGDQTGDILSISSICLIFGAIIVTPLFNRYRRFNLFLIIFCGASLVLLVGNIFAAQSRSLYLFGAAFLVYSTLMAPVLPISIDYAVDLSFPVAEFTTSGLWYSILAIFSAIQSLIIDQIVTNDPTTKGSRWALIALIGYQAVGSFPLFWVKERLKRTKYEQQGPLTRVVDSSSNDV